MSTPINRLARTSSVTASRTVQPAIITSDSPLEELYFGPRTAHPPAKKVKSTAPNFGDLGDLVTFIVGPKKTRLQVHKNPVYLSSPVLKMAFESNFAEGLTQTYTLEDVTERVFALFTEWIYTRKLLTDDYSMTDLCQALPRLWIMADKFLMPQLQNQVMDAMGRSKKSLQRSIFSQQEFKFLYENTSPDSPLRKFVLRQYVKGMTPGDVIKKPGAFPRQMLLELVHYQSEFLSKQSLQKKLPIPDAKDYHIKEVADNPGTSAQ